MSNRATSRVSHEEYQSMLETVLKLSPVELRCLAESMEKFASVFECDKSRGEPA